MLTDVFLVELYFTSLPGLYSSTGPVFPEPLPSPTAATSLWILLRDPARGHHGTRGNAVHTLMFPPPSHPCTHDFLIYFCSLLPGELNESKERSGKCLKKQLILSFHLGTETQVYLLGHSKACAGCCLKTNGKTGA